MGYTNQFYSREIYTLESFPGKQILELGKEEITRISVRYAALLNIFYLGVLQLCNRHIQTYNFKKPGLSSERGLEAEGNVSTRTSPRVRGLSWQRECLGRRLSSEGGAGY